MLSGNLIMTFILRTFQMIGKWKISQKKKELRAFKIKIGINNKTNRKNLPGVSKELQQFNLIKPQF